MTAHAEDDAADRRTIAELLATLEREIARHPAWPDLRHKTALAHLFLGDAAAAKRELEVAIGRNAKYLDAIRALAFAELALGNLDAALAAAERLERTTAPAWRALLGAGLVHAAAGRFEEARKRLERALAEAPDRPLPEYALSLVRAKLSKAASGVGTAGVDPAAIAREADRRVAGLGIAAPPGFAVLGNPGRGNLFREAACLAAANGGGPAAQGWLDRAVAIDLELGIDAAARADLDFAAGNLNGAIAGFRLAVQRDGELVKPRISLAYALGIKGELDGAIAEMLAASRLRPKYPDVRYQLGTLYLERLDYASAERELQAALELNRKYGAAQFALGLARFNQSDFQGAAAAFEEATDDTCQREEVLAHLGFARLKLGELEKAKASFEGAAAIDDSLPPPHLGLALIAEKQGDAGAARAHLAAYEKRECDLGDEDAAALRHRLHGAAESKADAPAK